MRTCLVLGAGATLANAQHFHSERRSATNPPLDYTFFEKISALSLTIPPELRSYAASAVGTDPFRLKPGQRPVRMEEFFRELYSDFQDASPGSTTALAYEQLVDVYVDVLRKTTNWLADDGRRGGPVGRLISEAAASSEALTMITFNHDLVIENEIYKRARLRRRWCIERSYGQLSGTLDFTVPKPSRGPLFPAHTAGCDHAHGITLLKLHGSLNWYIRMRGQHPSRAVLSGASRAPKLLCTRRRQVSQAFGWQPPTGSRGRTRWYTWPVVIPPVHGKEVLIRNFVPVVWADAETALLTADRVVFVGYSLPALDVQAERAFKRAIASNSVLERVDVVNPAPESAERYASLVAPTPMRWYPTIEAFLDLEGLA